LRIRGLHFDDEFSLRTICCRSVSQVSAVLGRSGLGHPELIAALLPLLPKPPQPEDGKDKKDGKG